MLDVKSTWKIFWTARVQISVNIYKIRLFNIGWVRSLVASMTVDLTAAFQSSPRVLHPDLSET